jgi:hypothetical protein
MTRLLPVSFAIVFSFVGCSSQQDNPCGTDPYADLPACTSALEGVECGREACSCCPDHWTCESGKWVVTGTNGGPLCADASTDAAQE